MEDRRGVTVDAYGTVAIHAVLMQAMSIRLPGPMPAQSIQHVHVPIWKEGRGVEIGVL